MIQIDKTSCIGCGLCVRDCFPTALSLEDGTAAWTAPDSCIGCGHCIAICPQNAVTEDSLPLDDMAPVHMAVPPEELLSLMQSRRSCRHFTKDAVPDSVVETLLSAARACPTAANLQVTRYILVRDAIEPLLDAALTALEQVGQAQIKTATDPKELRRANNFLRWRTQRQEDKSFDPLFFHAPLVMLFVSPPDLSRDAASAASYVELMAASLGLGCLYSGYFTACAAGSPEIQNMLGVAPTEQVVRCLVLGYPDVRFQRTAPRKTPQVTCL